MNTDANTDEMPAKKTTKRTLVSNQPIDSNKKQKISRRIIVQKSTYVNPKDKKIKLLEEKLKKAEAEVKKLSKSSLVYKGKKCNFCEKVLTKSTNFYYQPKKNKFSCFSCTKKLF